MINSPPISNTARERLRERNERVTPARVAILDALLQASSALSHQELVEHLLTRGEQFDRVTLYRVLDWLVAQKLAHKLASEDRVWRFNAVTNEQHPHPHFSCEQCGHVSCLDTLQQPLLPLPTGYTLHRAYLNLHGICPACQLP